VREYAAHAMADHHEVVGGKVVSFRIDSSGSA
jgi:hypothetical protein